MRLCAALCLLAAASLADEALDDAVEVYVENDAVLVDERAIGTDLGGKYVLVVGEDNIVEHRRVKLGQLDEGMRVIEAGLGPDERYIVTGLQRARPGLPVTPKTAEEAEPAGS